MVKLEIELEDVDYDALVAQFLPQISDHLKDSGNPAGRLLSGGMGATMAKGILRTMSQTQKDKLTCDILNQNKTKLVTTLEDAIEKKGFHVKIHAAKASAL